MYYNIIGVYT